jgi:hemerythrin-like domain-containing protein
MLDASHRRQEEAVSALLSAARRIAAGRGNEEDVDVVRDVAGFFERATPRHFADEETSLFPRLRDRGDADVGALLDRIAAEHRAHERAHAELRRCVGAVPDDGQVSATDGAALLAVATEIDRMYRDHIALEDAELIPAAQRLLDEDDLTAIITDMESRRGRGRG